MTDKFVFVIAYNCGKIANKCIETYHKFHNVKIHIIGTPEDFLNIPSNDNNKFINIETDENVKHLYKSGHSGTAYVWAKVIREYSEGYDYIVQIDSDVVFIDECLSDITNKLEDGYDLVGPRRSYSIHRPMPDVVGTCFIGVNKSLISDEINFDTLKNMCQGQPVDRIPIIDFFDPVSFHILMNNGKIFYLDTENYGSSNENESYDNGFLLLNTWYDFGKKFLHFAGVGSGMNFHENGHENVARFYAGWALHRYSAYMSIFHNEEINVENLITFEEAFSGASRLDVLSKTKEAIC
jgi:hypothetical protein